MFAVLLAESRKSVTAGISSDFLTNHLMVASSQPRPSGTFLDGMGNRARRGLISLVCAVKQSFVRRPTASLDLEVRDQPRGMAHKPWNELLVHVKMNCGHFLRSRPQRAELLCNLLGCSLDAPSTRAKANSCVEKHRVVFPTVTHQLCQLLDELVLITQEYDARPAGEAQCPSDDSNCVFVLALGNHCKEHST